MIFKSTWALRETFDGMGQLNMELADTAPTSKPTQGSLWLMAMHTQVYLYGQKRPCGCRDMDMWFQENIWVYHA